MAERLIAEAKRQGQLEARTVTAAITLDTVPLPVSLNARAAIEADYFATRLSAQDDVQADHDQLQGAATLRRRKDARPLRLPRVLRVGWHPVRPHVLEHECNNPEVGRRILFEREAAIVDPKAKSDMARGSPAP